MTLTIEAGVLFVAYDEYGPADGWPCILGHGFPYDPHAYAEAAPILAEAGARVIVPYLRGFGPTRFRAAGTPRSGEQAALGADLLALMNGLRVERAVLGGYDWGGAPRLHRRALWPVGAPSRSSPAIPTTSRTSRARWSRLRLQRRRRFGINSIFTASEVGAA